ncbi:MAG: hypothetical protein MI919_19115, partial [Holophagales bacterium]|nr:hypothetical protein [Holophagales bacterium]
MHPKRALASYRSHDPRTPSSWLSAVACNALLFALAAPTAAAGASAGTDGPAPSTPGSAAEALADVRAAFLDPGAARHLEGVSLDTGFARLTLIEGTLFPVRTPAGRLAEMVFLGEGKLHVEPPDPIEAGQLELFTGGSTLHEPFGEAVFVIASDSAQAALLERPAAGPLTLEEVARARERLRAWRERRERELFEVEAGLTLDHLGDPLYDSYFTAWFRGRELGELFLSVEPEEEEQITLGRFQPLELESRRDARRLRRQLHRSQRRGRLLGLELEDLGLWDSWLSTSLVAQDGEPITGGPAYEPRHYRLEAELDPDSLELRGL